MKKQFLCFALVPSAILFINSVLLLEPKKEYNVSYRNVFNDSIKFIPHEIYPQYWMKDYFEFENQIPINNLNLFTNSVFPNINISRDSFPQNEPSVKISRNNPNIVVAAWRDFRTGIDPALRRIGYGRSTDGGKTWNCCGLLDSFSTEYPLASDPAVCVDTASNFYISTISLNLAKTLSTVVVYKSTNEGVSFDNAFNIAPHPDSAGYFDDKEYITCDHVSGSPFRNNIYVAWAGYNGMAVCRTTNSGLNWSERIILPIQGGGTGLVPVVGADGEIYVVWMGNSFSFGQKPGIYFNKSSNGGLNFSSETIIDTLASTSFLRLPSIATDISNGERHGFIYAVWSNTVSGDEDVYLKYSSDRGASWSPRKRINNDSLGNGKKQYWPWITVNEAGSIFILYYDCRNSSSDWIVEAYLAYSTDGGQTFGNELLSTQQFSTMYSNWEIRFGDYIGIDSWDGKIVPVWTDARAGGTNQEIYTAVILDSLIGIKQIAGISPSEFKLYQNYPNPFNPSTTIKFEIPEYSNVSFKIFDVLGREIEILIDGLLRAGTYEIKWNALEYSSGVYFYKLVASDYTEVKKMVLIK